MSDCGCEAPEVKTAQERRVLRIALALNAVMAVIGGLAGWIAQSTGLLADVVANFGVILAGLLILWLGVPYPDYVIGTLIGLYVIKEAIEILRDARSEATNKKTGS